MRGLRKLHRGGRLAWTDRPARKDTPQPADVIKLLIKFGAKPNTRSYFGTDALYDAIDADDVDAARALIDGGLDINSTIYASMPGEIQPSNRGQTALMHALGRYDLRMVQAGKHMIGMLLEKGADPNVTLQGRFISGCGQGTPPCTFSGETPLSYVARLGYKDFARLLLEHGANPDGVRADGAKPAEIATQAGHIETAALIEHYEKQHSEAVSTDAPHASIRVQNVRP
jgi:ankyrin repeat protein